MKLSDINKKGEGLMEQGEQLRQRKEQCAQRVSAAGDELAAAQASLDAALSEQDENGNPTGDVSGAQARVARASAALREAQEALERVAGEIERNNREKSGVVEEIGRYNAGEQRNLSQLEQLRQKRFGGNAAAFAANLAARMNSGEEMRDRLLQSMGLSGGGRRFSAGSGSGGAVSGGPGGFASGAPAGQTSAAAAGADGERAPSFPDTPFGRLSEYMCRHNYGKDDYPVYSQDPEWQRLHAEAFPDWHRGRERGTTGGDEGFGDGVALERDRLNDTNFFSRGAHYEAFRDYWEHQADYQDEPCEERMVWVRARDVEGVYLSDRERSMPEQFWTRKSHPEGIASMEEKASHLAEIRRRMDAGESAESLMEDPVLGPSAGAYLGRPIRVGQGEGFYVFQGDGRHRTLGAQSLDVEIPVIVTRTIRRR